jgi:hypothetical protein
MGYTLRGTIKSTKHAVLGGNPNPDVDEFAFQPVFSPSTTALVLETTQWREDLRQQNDARIRIAPFMRRAIIEEILSMNSEEIITILAVCDLSWCGIDGIDAISTSMCKGMFSGVVKRKEGKNTVAPEDQPEFGIPNFFPV